ncbi:C-type lectin BfL-2-like [Haliotis asinina]|uniref:C-type lectin BfL-2-like n=1 Tax=Haliotis asinina TaxID=109174 RepID=UPI003532514F
MACSEMTVSSVSTGQVPPSLPPGSPAMSRIDCASLCFFSVYCTTMFYNRDTKTCVLMEGFNQTQLAATSENIERLVLGKAACPIKSGYLYNRKLNMCYKKHTGPKIWSDAKTSCSLEGDYLVIINSAERNQFMFDIAADIGPFWTSGNILEATFWTWGDNSQIVDPTFWSPGEPSGPTSEKCLMFYDLKLSKSWHSAQCENHRTAYVCEIAM